MKSKPTPREKTPPATSSAWQDRAERFGHTWLAFLAASMVVLLPCFWQSRLQAGDLSSHLYNAWLAQLIEAGRAPGLSLAHQTTNILFDWMLSGLLRTAGADAAQRISVALSVLAFVWGSFAFVSVVNRVRAWHSLPVIAILAYGWVFHMGFFNFYLSLGLCFGAMALCWEWKPLSCAIAVPILALAYLAHALPVAWALSLLVYHWLAARLTGRQRLYLLGASVVAIGVLRSVIVTRMFTRWFPNQFLSALGVYQVWVFDSKYALVMVSLAILWGLSLFRLQLRPVLVWLTSSTTLQFCLLTACGIAVIPTGILFPGYKHILSFIAERMSLPLCICICATLAGVPLRSYQRYLMGAMVVVFFALVFQDERSFNALEDRLEEAIALLPAGQRVINGVAAPTLRIDGVTHLVDRACINHCYSYANYEPSTAQFRVRGVAESPIVVTSYDDSLNLQAGLYVVKERDEPLYQVVADPKGRLYVRTVAAGIQTGMSFFNPL